MNQVNTNTKKLPDCTINPQQGLDSQNSCKALCIYIIKVNRLMGYKPVAKANITLRIRTEWVWAAQSVGLLVCTFQPCLVSIKGLLYVSRQLAEFMPNWHSWQLLPFDATPPLYDMKIVEGFYINARPASCHAHWFCHSVAMDAFGS